MISYPTQDSASKFVESVLALRPKLAVFDCDGTLWSGDAGRDFFYWEMEQGIVGPDVAEAMRERYRLYELGEVGEEAGASRFGIPRERVLAACVHSSDGIATNRLLRVPTDELKVTAIREVIGRPVDAIFGNSVHDQAMLEIAKCPFCVNPNSDLEEVAGTRNWPIYWPNRMRSAAK